MLVNKPDFNAKLLIQKHFGTSFCAVQGNVASVPKKPDKAGALLILERLGIDAHECIYIGDSDVDIFTAKALGCKSIGAAWGFRSKEELQEAGADYIASSPEQIPKIIQMLQHSL